MTEFNPTEWITVKEAARITPYAPVTLRYLAREGLVKAQKWGRDWFLDRESLLAYVKEMERLGTAKHDPRRTGVRHKDDEGE